MGNFEGISRQLRYTFAELESAQGTVKRRWLRKAHLLLLLADEMIADREADAPNNDTPSVSDRLFNDDSRHARTLLRAFAENAVRSTDRGSCRVLQSLLVFRHH